jgi:hypothetical protein
MQTFDEAGKFGTQFVDNGLKSFAALSKGLQAISLEAADYSRQAVESTTAATEKLMTSQSLEKALEAQADYMKTAYEGFVAQATRMSGLCADMAKDVCLPFESPVAKK